VAMLSAWTSLQDPSASSRPIYGATILTGAEAIAQPHQPIKPMREFVSSRGLDSGRRGSLGLSRDPRHVSILPQVKKACPCANRVRARVGVYSV